MRHPGHPITTRTGGGPASHHATTFPGAAGTRAEARIVTRDRGETLGPFSLESRPAPRPAADAGRLPSPARAR